MEPSEQAPSTPPPKRRRRRWLIVAFVLVLVGVAWWNWPRGDARFVGKWQLVRESGPLPAFMVFSSNGSGHTTDASGKITSLFSWQLDQGVLIYRPPLGLAPSSRLSTVNRALRKYIGFALLEYEQRADVLTITHDMLNTRLAGWGNSFNLRRIPE